MKNETIKLVEVEVNENMERYKNSGYNAEIVYLPCIILRGSKGEVTGMEYPNTSTIIKSENKGMNL